jgi:hypothetical protein
MGRRCFEGRRAEPAARANPDPTGARNSGTQQPAAAAPKCAKPGMKAAEYDTQQRGSRVKKERICL